MIMQAEAQRTYSPEEYLELEVNSAERHEYRDGKIIPISGGTMTEGTVAGGTPNHNQIALNLSGALNFALKRSLY